MRYKYLTICLLLALYGSPASGMTATDTTESSSPSALPTMMPAPRRSSSGGGGAHFFYGIELGYAGATTKAANFSGSGGGFLYGGEMGAKISLPCRNQNKSNFLSISLSGTAFTINQKYKDPLGNSQTTKLNFGVAALPVSFTNMSYGRGGEGVGFYWQLGIDPDYIASVKNNDTKETSHYNSVYFEPFASLGFSVPFVLRNRRTHSDVGGGRALMGLFFGYDATNMAKDSGVTMTGYNVGVKWCYIFM
jgi:hypothetical protein